MSIISLRKIKPAPSDQDADVLTRMQKRVKDWFDYYADNIQNYKDDTEFTYWKDGQWTPAEIDEYDRKEHKPRMTFNMLPKLLHVLEGEYSDFSPDIMVRAIDSSDTDQDKIDLLTNLTREISFKSRNDIVYQTAMNCALTGGFGAFRIISAPENEYSFNYMPKYLPIYDPTKAFWDRSARNFDKGDGICCGYLVVWNKEELKSKYPQASENLQSFAPSGIDPFWETKEEITVAEYYEKKFFKRRIALLSNNLVVDADNAEQIIQQFNERMAFMGSQGQMAPQMPITIVKEEERDDYVIHYYRAIHDQILEQRVWDGKKLPVLFQPGYIKWIRGREYTYSLVRFLRDTQRAYNYARSEFLYRLKLTRYEPFIAPEETIAKYQKNWANVYTAKGVLPYTETKSGLRPERVSHSEIPQSLTLEIERAYNDFQRISGRFDANLGAPSNETSGVAILNRQRPGNMSVKIFFDNSLKTIESGANVALDLAQNIMDTERKTSVTLSNGEQNNVLINADGGQTNNITDGMFNVEIKASASFEIQRNAQLEQITRIIGANQQLSAILPDKLIELSGIKDAPQLVKRAQKYLIPQITFDETNDPQLKQELGQQLQHQQQQQAMLQQQQQLEMLSTQSKIQDDRIKAISNQLTGIANLINAQSNQAEAQTKGALEAAKIVAEDRRTELETEKEAIKAVSQNMREFPLNLVQNEQNLT